MDVGRLLDLAKVRKTADCSAEWRLPARGEHLASWVAPLATDGSVIPGLSLSLHIPFARSGETDGLTALMIYRLSGSNWTIGRIELCPVGAPPHHRNNKPVLMKDSRFRPLISGSHAHLAEDNARFGLEAFQHGNLPAAVEIDWKGGYRNAISIVGAHFGIEGLWCGDELPWDRRLF